MKTKKKSTSLPNLASMLGNTPKKRKKRKVAKRSIKKTPAKKAPAKKRPAKKAPAKKRAIKKRPAKKAPAKKRAIKKRPAKKAPAKKRAIKKAPAKKRAIKKAPAKKRAIKKAPAKKRASKKAPAKKRAIKKAPAKKRAIKKAPAKKAPAKKRAPKEPVSETIPRHESYTGSPGPWQDVTVRNQRFEDRNEKADREIPERNRYGGFRPFVERLKDTPGIEKIIAHRSKDGWFDLWSYHNLPDDPAEATSELSNLSDIWTQDADITPKNVGEFDGFVRVRLGLNDLLPEGVASEEQRYLRMLGAPSIETLWRPVAEIERVFVIAKAIYDDINTKYKAVLVSNAVIQLAYAPKGEGPPRDR